MPKLMQSHPASRMILSVSRSTVLTRAKALQPKFTPLLLISPQSSLTRALLAVNRSSATLMRVNPRERICSISSTTRAGLLKRPLKPTMRLPRQKMHLLGHPRLVMMLTG